MGAKDECDVKVVQLIAEMLPYLFGVILMWPAQAVTRGWEAHMTTWIICQPKADELQG